MDTRKFAGEFKRQVLKACNGICENPNCDQEATTIHHMFKVSRYPEYAFDVRNGIGFCGTCHSEEERRLRMGVESLIPYKIGEMRSVLEHHRYGSTQE